MNHWYTVDQLATGRRADLDREAAGGIRMHASDLEAGKHSSGDPGRGRGPRPVGQRQRHLTTALRSGLTVIIDRSRHAAALIERRRAGLTDGR